MNPTSQTARATPAAAGPTRSTWLRPAGIVLIVLAVVATVHAPVLRSQASSLDDFQFIGTNPLVLHPSWNSVGRFFGEVSNPSTVGGYYIPLTMTSLMLDSAAGGRPNDLRVYHRTNFALHLLNVALLLLILAMLFGSWEAAAVAALVFGLHPLTVEPIAWVSERKTLLATLLAFAVLATYLRGVHGGRPWRAASIALFALALLAKPTVLPLPILLLLLDVWPLRRWSRRIVFAKWPYFALALGSGVITLVSHEQTVGVIAPNAAGVAHWPLRIGCLLGVYLKKIVWPVNLSCVYPDPGPYNGSNLFAVLSTLVLLALTGLLVGRRRRCPGALVSWLFFVLALLPTLGLLRYSWVEVSDKYVYFPALGLVLGLCGLLAAMLRRWSRRPPMFTALAVVIVALLATESLGVRRALAPWSDSLTLYRHMETIAPNSSVVQGKLGFLLKQQGDLAAALPHFDQAARLAPQDAETAFQHGLVLGLLGRPEEGAAEFQRALRLDPTFKEASDQLGCAWAMTGKYEEAAAQFRRTLELDPDDGDVRLQLATALLEIGGRDAEGVRELRELLTRAPDRVDARNQLAWTLAVSSDASVRDGAEAVRLAEESGNDSLATQIRGRLREYAMGAPKKRR